MTEGEERRQLEGIVRRRHDLGSGRFVGTISWTVGRERGLEI